MKQPAAAFQKGDEVTVYNQSMRGELIIEGRATIVRPTGIEHQYKVTFKGAELGDPGRKGVYRFVFAGPPQDDPESYLAAARREWLERQKSDA